MPQLIDNWISPEEMVRSRAWREGYESFRRGEPPVFSGRGAKSLAYEYGRQTAAYLRGRGERLLPVPTTRPLYSPYVPPLAAALRDCLASEAPPPPGAG